MLDDRSTTIMSGEERPQKEDDRATTIISDSHSSSEDDRATTILNGPDDRSTTVMSNKDDRATTILNRSDDRATTVLGSNPYKSSDNIKLNDRSQEPGFNNSSLKSFPDIGDVVGNGFLIDRLLSDTSGEANLYVCVKDNQEYVLKAYKKSLMEGVRNDKDNIFLNGAMKTVQSINSPYVIPIIEYGKFTQYRAASYYSITPFYKNGNIAVNFSNISDEFILNHLIHDVNEGLHAFHVHKLLHRDIKPQNMYLSDDKTRVILGDIGTAVSLNDSDHVTNVGQIGTKRYHLNYGGVDTPQSDYYSFGYSLIDIACHKDVDEGIKQNEVVKSDALRGKLIPESINQDIRELIFKLIHFDSGRGVNDIITYDGVNKWLENHKVYRGCITISEEEESKETLENGYTFSCKGVNKRYFHSPELAKALTQD